MKTIKSYIKQNSYRIFCGDLGNEVTDDTLTRVFTKYPSFQKARVVRDKNTMKSRGLVFFCIFTAIKITEICRLYCILKQ